MPPRRDRQSCVMPFVTNFFTRLPCGPSGAKGFPLQLGAIYERMDFSRIDILVKGRNQMAKPVSISLSKFTASVKAAVKAAVAKHPKFNLPVPNAVSVFYLIRGIPVPEEIMSKVTLGETQAFATE